MEENGLTHAEISALIGATEKSAGQLAAIVGQMTLIVSTQHQVIAMQERILTRLVEELPKHLTSAILPDLKAVQDQMRGLEANQRWQGWVLTSVGGITGLVVLVKSVLLPLLGHKP
jgi:hypothetical protein